MKYDRTHAGLRLKPSADGIINFPRLTSETRATLLGITEDGRRINIHIDGLKVPGTWARRYWIPLRGNKAWTSAQANRAEGVQ